MPGDLIYYGPPGASHHVVVYAGNGLVVEAEGSAYPLKSARSSSVSSTATSASTTDSPVQRHPMQGHRVQGHQVQGHRFSGVGRHAVEMGDLQAHQHSSVGHHGAAVVVPVRVLPGDPAVEVDQRLDRGVVRIGGLRTQRDVPSATA